MAFRKGSAVQKREKLELELIALGMKKRPSKMDGCHVVDMRCDNCGGAFEEEYEQARALKCSAMPSICIQCEGATGDVKAPRITVKGVLLLWSLGS
jgi:hypothetical protein